MGIGRVGRIGRVARVGAGGIAAPLGGNDILTITDDGGGTALVTTATAHNLNDGVDTVVISGTSNAAYNSVPGVVTVITPTTFHTNQTWVGDSIGGTWALV